MSLKWDNKEIRIERDQKLGLTTVEMMTELILANSFDGPTAYCATYIERKEVKAINGLLSTANKCTVGGGGEGKVAFEGDLHRICFVFCIVDDLKRN